MRKYIIRLAAISSLLACFQFTQSMDDKCNPFDTDQTDLMFVSNDSRTDTSQTALNEWFELVKCLMANGADAKIQDNRATALMSACQKGDEELELVRWLVKKGANPKAQDKE